MQENMKKLYKILLMVCLFFTCPSLPRSYSVVFQSCFIVHSCRQSHAHAASGYCYYYCYLESNPMEQQQGAPSPSGEMDALSTVTVLARHKYGCFLGNQGLKRALLC